MDEIAEALGINLNDPKERLYLEMHRKYHEMGSALRDARKELATRPAMSFQRLAERWDVNEITIRRMHKDGELFAFRVGRQFRVPWSEVKRVEAIPNQEEEGLKENE